jgi:hypothetical protein
MVAKRTCPRCGATVNVGNLPRHFERVHPRDDVAAALSTDERRTLERRTRVPMSAAGRRRLVGASLAVAAVLFVVWLLSWSTVPTGGVIHIEPASYDFGEIGQSTVSTTFLLHNLGSSVLVLQGVSTSCMCTSARVVYGGVASPTFGYHDNPGGWSLALPPDAEASLDVFYDPTVHPELGHFMREVYVLSSDPGHREASVQIHATEV